MSNNQNPNSRGCAGKLRDIAWFFLSRGAVVSLLVSGAGDVVKDFRRGNLAEAALVVEPQFRSENSQVTINGARLPTEECAYALPPYGPVGLTYEDEKYELLTEFTGDKPVYLFVKTPEGQDCTLQVGPWGENVFPVDASSLVEGDKEGDLNVIQGR